MQMQELMQEAEELATLLEQGRVDGSRAGHRDIAQLLRRIVGAHDSMDNTVANQEAVNLAWGLIANAYGGDWSAAHPGWADAAADWRDKYALTFDGPDTPDTPAPRS